MKKLLLTATISGVMMSGGGAFADKKYYIWGCPDPGEIQAQQLIHKTLTFTYKEQKIGLIYQVTHNAGKPPKQITEIWAGPSLNAPHNAFEMTCTYDNGIVAKLYMKDCKDEFKE